MALDGIVIKNLAEELNSLLAGGRVEKVFQPEKDEIVLSIRSAGNNYRLLLTSNANYPRIHLTEVIKENPTVPPGFCMLLRKHLTGAKILSITAPDYERVAKIVMESLNELGDLGTKRLIIEMMGRYSNIILVSDEGKIIDSIRHIDDEMSSVREVLPGRMYMPPPPQDKTIPDQVDVEALVENPADEIADVPVEKALLQSIKGFSPVLCREICHRAGLDSSLRIPLLSDLQKNALKNVLKEVLESIISSKFTPCIIYDASEKPIEFHSLRLEQYTGMLRADIDSINLVLDTFYSLKDRAERLKQRRSDLVKIVNTHLDRCLKKLALQNEKLQEVAERETLRLYGELLTANLYSLKKGMDKAVLINYYSETGEQVTIPLDPNLTPSENAQAYFKKYNKAKSAFQAVTEQIEINRTEIEYLESVLQSLENCSTVKEIDEIREELENQGILSAKNRASYKKEKPSSPMHFVSSDGFDIFVGKNNRQNDTLTLKSSRPTDLWLHTRNIPGSHVIIRSVNGQVSDQALTEGATLAAYYSKAKNSSHVPVDYTTVKNVKKPQGAKPGMVNYFNFKTILVTPREEEIKKLRQIE